MIDEKISIEEAALEFLLFFHNYLSHPLLPKYPSMNCVFD